MQQARLAASCCAAPVDRIQWAAPALCVEMGFTQTFQGKLLWIKLWPMHAGLVAQCHGRVGDRIQWAGFGTVFWNVLYADISKKTKWNMESKVWNLQYKKLWLWIKVCLGNFPPCLACVSSTTTTTATFDLRSTEPGVCINYQNLMKMTYWFPRNVRVKTLFNTLCLSEKGKKVEWHW